MTDRRTPHWFSTVVGRSGHMTAHVKMLSFTVVLSAGLVLLPVIPAWAARAALPADVPNIYAPEVQAHFQPVMVANLRANPEFPLILLVNTAAGQKPDALLLGLDARNGKDTWSLTGDPIILIVAFSGETVQGMYVDAGFAGHGAASGIYATVDEANSAALPDLLNAVPEVMAQTYI